MSLSDYMVRSCWNKPKGTRSLFQSDSMFSHAPNWRNIEFSNSNHASKQNLSDTWAVTLKSVCFKTFCHLVTISKKNPNQFKLLKLPASHHIRKQTRLIKNRIPYDRPDVLLDYLRTQMYIRYLKKYW